MLAGLGEVDWSSLHHAYGSAEDVPELLRAMLDPEKAGEAVTEFFTNIWHQGTVYEATAHAVPFLFELLADGRQSQREALLHLLRCIATGGSYLAAHRSVLPVQGGDERDLDARQRQEEQWVADARRAVTGRVRDLVDLLTDADPSVRAGAAYVLAACGQAGVGVIDVLERRLVAEDDPDVLASIVPALAELGEVADPSVAHAVAARLGRLVIERPDPLVCVLATVAASVLSPEERLPIGPVDLAHAWSEAQPRWRDSLWAVEERWQDPLGLLPLRVRLKAVATVLRTGGAESRLAVMYSALELHQQRRDVGEALAPLLDAQLRAGDTQVVERAAYLASEWGSTGRMCADSLAGAVFDLWPRMRRHPPGDVGVEGATFNSAVLALTLLRDERVVPILASVSRAGPPDTLAAVIEELGPFAPEALPGLTAILRGGADLGAPLLSMDPALMTHNLPIQAAQAIGRFRDQAHPFLDVLAWAVEAGPPAGALLGIGELGPVGAELLPLLDRVLQQQRSPRSQAAWAWLRVGGDPRRIVGLLPDLIDEPFGTRIAAELGPSAVTVLPLVRERMLRHGRWADPWALRAVWRITADPDVVLPALVEAAGPGDVGVEAVRILEEMGRAAQPAAGRLRELAESAIRPRPTVLSRVVWNDELLISACRSALGAQ